MTAPAEIGPSPSVSDDDLANGVYLSLVRALRWLRRTGPTDIGHGGLSAMATLLTAGPMRSGQLADREGVAPSTMSRIIDSLVGEALAERIPDPADRRALMIRLTPAGSAAIESTRAVRAGALRARLAELPAAEQDAIRAALPALAHLVSA